MSRNKRPWVLVTDSIWYGGDGHSDVDSMSEYSEDMELDPLLLAELQPWFLIFPQYVENLVFLVVKIKSIF